MRTILFAKSLYYLETIFIIRMKLAYNQIGIEILSVKSQGSCSESKSQFYFLIMRKSNPSQANIGSNKSRVDSNGLLVM